MSFTPGAPLRRSFKEDRDDRRRRKQVSSRVKIIGGLVALVVLAGIGFALYSQAGISAVLSGWQKPKATPPKASVSMHTVPFKVPKIALFPASPTPAASPTPKPTQSPAPTPSPSSSPRPTPKPAKTPAPKRNVAFGPSFFSPPTPAVPTTTVTTPAPATPTPAPATPTPAAEVYAPQVVVDARFANRVQPDYPEIARAQNAEGTAVVLVTVGPKGNVISQRLEKSAGHPSLDQAALAAASHSTFLPPKIDGKPATETYRVIYAFAP